MIHGIALGLILGGAIASPKTFGVTQRDGWWSLSDPSGKPFWSFGVDCVETGVEKSRFNPDNPGYHAWGLFPDDEAWVKDTLTKLRSWGFNTIGAWSAHDKFEKHSGSEALPFAAVLHLGAYNKAPWNDIFSDATRKEVDGAARDQIPGYRDQPNLIGYFTDNELAWWDDTLFFHYLNNLGATERGHLRLLELFREQYGHSLAKLKKDWLTQATTWDEFERAPTVHLRPGGNGMALVNRWTYTMSRYYYELMAATIKKYDPHHLILGERYVQYYNHQSALASRGLVDVTSTNKGADWVDGTLSYYFLDTLTRLTRTPVLITEFYMAARQNQSGNRNSSDAFPIVDTQKERAESFKRNVQAFAKFPNVVGAHWFQFADEPPKGRGDGEDFNMGLVDVYGKTYDLLTKAAAASRPAELRRGPIPKFDATQASIPPAIKDPLSKLKNREKTPTLLDWPRHLALVPSASPYPFGDLYATWEKDNLYLAIYATDFIDERLYENAKIPESERCLWKIDFGQKRAPLEIRYGGKDRPASCSRSDLEIRERTGLQETLIVRIPARSLGLKSLKPGLKLKINSSLTNHSRAESMRWQSTLTLKP